MRQGIVLIVFYLIATGFLTAIYKFLKPKISFSKTLSHALIAVIAVYIISSFLWTALVAANGYFWGEIPTSVLLLQWIILALPLIIAAIVLFWSVKQQLRAGKQEY